MDHMAGTISFSPDSILEGRFNLKRDFSVFLIFPFFSTPDHVEKVEYLQTTSEQWFMGGKKSV